MVQGERCSTEFSQEESARQTTILREMCLAQMEGFVLGTIPQQ